MQPISDLKAFLSGEWQVERSLLDQRALIHGSFRGQARFSPVGSGLRYKEQGRLTFGAHDGPAEQGHLYEFDHGCARAFVSFRDGRPFHELDLSNGEALVYHACGPDLYEGRFAVLNSTKWQSEWKIAGPRKDQEIHSFYTRLP